MEPRIEFATAADGTRIAWTAVGDGPAVVITPGVPLSNFEAEWQIPVTRRALERLAGRLRVIQYDGRGTGRSQRDVTDLSLDAHVSDLDAVLQAAGGGRGPAWLLSLGRSRDRVGGSAPGALPRPGPVRWRCARLGSDARGRGPRHCSASSSATGTHSSSRPSHAWLGWPDDAEGRAAADWFRTSTSPAVARATLQASAEMDVTSEAATIRRPALVLHRRDAQVIPLDVSRALADLLPNGRLEMLPGSSASLFFERTDEVVDRLIAFAARSRRADPPASPTDARRARSSERAAARSCPRVSARCCAFSRPARATARSPRRWASRSTPSSATSATSTARSMRAVAPRRQPGRSAAGSR